jgi:hypothetical protein
LPNCGNSAVEKYRAGLFTGWKSPADWRAMLSNAHRNSDSHKRVEARFNAPLCAKPKKRGRDHMPVKIFHANNDNAIYNMEIEINEWLDKQPLDVTVKQINTAVSSTAEHSALLAVTIWYVGPDFPK